MLEMSRTAVVGVAVLVASACGRGAAEGRPPDDPLALAMAPDLNPDPNILEVDLEARAADKSYGDGPATRVWTYNGSVPGPLLDATVGDRVVVHFKNSLPEATTIHWHGVRVPAAMDGSLAMQSPVQPGGSFEYSFTLKDAGLYWFHPHMRSDIQVQKGLYGVIRVRDRVEPEADLEHVLVLDDVRLGPDGTITEYLDDTAAMMGREGKMLLVNGVANARLAVDPGSLVRLRIVNVANARFFNLRLPGLKWHVIGVDGGLLPEAYDTETLLIAPGERYDVMLVVSSAPSTELVVTNEPYDRGHQSGGAPPMPLLTLAVSASAPLSGRSFPRTTRALERLPTRPADFPLDLDEVVQGDSVVFTINGAAYPNVPPIIVSSGDVRALEVKNTSEMDHPFHLHGFFFQVIARNDVPPPPEELANKDTIIVPAKSSLRLVSRFDEPGTWMYHCHILEHAEGGMMGELHVQ